MYMVFFLLEFGHPNHKKNISSHLPLLLSSPADSCGFIYSSVRYMSLGFTISVIKMIYDSTYYYNLKLFNFTIYF